MLDKQFIGATLQALITEADSETVAQLLQEHLDQASMKDQLELLAASVGKELLVKVAMQHASRELAEQLFLKLIDTKRVAERLSAASKEKGVDKEVTKASIPGSATAHHVQALGMLNSGYVFWDDDVQRWENRYAPQRGRPSLRGRPKEI